jgi:dephospho-CoA kinase
LSKWPGKYVIGLTGNIATGKSVVRRMLEHLGAYTIDADSLSHRAIAKGAPGYQPVVDAFGKFILNVSGEIDRSKLGRLAFGNPEVLQELETIVHPLVEQAIDIMAKRASQHIVVIEAIKLIEGKLDRKCDSVWTTYAPESIQKARLMQKRGMNEQEALTRIRSQSPQAEKTSVANVIIQNVGSFEDTWKQVVAAWKLISPVTDTTPVVVRKGMGDQLAVLRGRPRDSVEIAKLISRLRGGTQVCSADDVMAAFGDKAFLLLMAEKQLVGLVGWQVENLVARTTDFYLDPDIASSQALKILITEVEHASQDLQCEASLLFLPPQMAKDNNVWKELGYAPSTPQNLGAQAWQDAALESQPSNTILFFKQLRQDRVLRPI